MALVLALRNDSERPQRIALPSAQTHDFAIAAADGRELWRWSAGRMFAQMLSEVALAPGEEKRYRATWNQTTAGGEAAPPGRYRASGWIPGDRARLPLATAEFTID